MSVAPTHLEVTLEDANGAVVERTVLPVFAALEVIARYALEHGADPEARGAAAQPGVVRFSPVESGPTPTPTQVAVGRRMGATLRAARRLQAEGRRG